MIKKWKKLDSKQIFEHPRLNLFEDTVELPDGQTGPYLHFGEVAGAVTIIVFDKGKILLQKEYSYPPNAILWQFPGGGINLDEAPIDAAHRELAEECDLKGELEPLGSYLINNRRSAAKMHVFLATNPSATIGQKDPEEAFELAWFKLEELEEMIKSSEIQNVHAIAALHLMKLNLAK